MKRVRYLVGISVLLLSGCSKDQMILEDESKKQITVEYGDLFEYDPQSIGIQAKEMDAITYNQIDLTQLGKQTITYEYHKEQLMIEAILPSVEHLSIPPLR